MLNAGTLVEKYGNKITGQGGARTYPYPLKKSQRVSPEAKLPVHLTEKYLSWGPSR